MTVKSKEKAIILLVAILTVSVSVAALVFSIVKLKKPGGTETPFYAGIYSPGKVGYAAEYLGTTERRLPEIKNGGLSRYPAYGVTLSGATAEEKSAILAENNAICASASTYDGMDADGNLYLGGVPTGNKLYKHTASVGLYEGNVSDSAVAVIKKITMQARPAGNHLTGLYAPAGEVVKIEMTEEDLKATGGLIVRIGQALQNGQANNIWAARDFNRMPVVLNTMTAKETASYVGSYLGGPIYVQPVNAGAEFSVTISGAVPYLHYIHGYTTREEFEELKGSSAPYFDLEVWDDSVRHSGPRARAEQFDYDQIVSAAVLWDKISRVSNRVPSGSIASIGITFLYDPFVAAGGMVAFVGRSTVNCPLYCLTAALDAESAVTDSSDAFWGCVHEYNHHYQRYGFAPGDEVTNNAVSLVSYSLYTANSANRSTENANEGSYATGWDRYTNPSWALKQTLSNANVNSGLDSYVNLLHAFGQKAFLQATKNGNGAGGADVWYKAVSDATGYDMTYYFTEVLHQTVSESVLTEYAAKKYPVFVPVATIYQTGRSYLSSDGKTLYSRTAQPYGIETGKTFTVDLNTNLVLPQGFTYRIKSVTQPEHGTLTKAEENVYTYAPAQDFRESGNVFVTLEITKEDGAFSVDDVELVLCFRQKQDRPTLLERTVYTYTDETMPKSPTEAYAAGYAGYTEKIVGDNENPTQNCNTDIWVPNPSKNAVMEVRGKFYVASAGKYRVALRTRQYAALYLSLDGENYQLAANAINLTNSVAFDQTNENNYRDYEFEKGQFVYFKEVLLVSGDRSFVGMGLGRFIGDTVTVGYLNAYRTSYERETFESDYYFAREYPYDYQEVGGRQTLIAADYVPWDDSKPIDLLFDDDDTNWIHSGRVNVSEDAPFSIAADLGEEMRANRFTIYGEPSRAYLPKDFRLYGGTDLDRLELIAEVKDAEVQNSNVTVDFDSMRVRYYRLVVTDTRAEGQSYRYVAFRCVKFSYSADGGKWISPDESMLEYRGKWRIDSDKLATFGHLYVGENATLNFTFTGTRFVIFACAAQDFDGFEVRVDGKLVDTVSLRGNKSRTIPAYLSDVLSKGKHEITVTGKGKFNIDSVALWD